MIVEVEEGHFVNTEHIKELNVSGSEVRIFYADDSKT